ncbi:hypothetical protein CHLRE_03g156550v5 [Chlamydomonas reinhardtii]|uniref:DEP domain-containing protein n=1 Tax=Chlamydomonas reinhardtii TaxID=3055 RepID=A0A2K3DW24_CHLRE|nr:uncharacterized protein CHLRE_03g156550v5 [Chlamydomonas reinhardtii]PNW84735.1 hypothetical protein CHLRE_03g156550v5 [Chlamydomonas reinhardtii]
MAPKTTEDLLQLATAMRGGVRIKDRRYLFRCYRACFVGQEAVAWLVAAGAAAGPAEAVALGNSMMEAGLFHHVVYEHRFEDDYLFYRFTDDNHVGGTAGAGAAPAPAAAPGLTPSGKRRADKVQQPAVSAPVAVAAAGAAASGAAPYSPRDSRGGSSTPPMQSPRTAVAGGGGLSGGVGGAGGGHVGLDTRVDVALGTAPSQDVSEACGGGAGGGAAGGGGAKALLLSEPRQDRSRQVMAGHLQQLQGRVTRMQQAAEAQKAIADILVSEVSSLRAEAAALRAGVSAASAAAGGAAAVAAHAQQQVAALRVLCFGLCACVLQQAVMSWLAEARAAAATAAVPPGAALLVMLGRGGPGCWGLALAVVVALAGLLVVLFPPPLSGQASAVAVAAAPAIAEGAAGKAGGAELLQQSLAAAAANAAAVPGGVDDAASEGWQILPPPLRRSLGERLLSSVYASAVGSARASTEAIGTGGAATAASEAATAGAAELSRALAQLPGEPGLPAPCVSSGSGGGAGGGAGGSGSSFSTARRAKEMARVLTAPLRLHLPRKRGKSAAATPAAGVSNCADEALPSAPQALRAHASGLHSASVSSRSGSGTAAIAAPGAGGPPALLALGGATATTNTVQLQASCAAGREPQARPAAFGTGHHDADDGSTEPAGTQLPQAHIPHAPGPADFCGWPDAPVLLTFNTAVVPEHAAAVAAVVAEAAAAGTATVEADAATAAGSEAAAAGSDAASCAEGAASDCPWAARRSLSTATSMSTPPQAAQPLAPSLLLRLPANDAARPIRVETDIFRGEVVVLLRGLATTPEDLFCGRRRMSWVAMQGRFKAPLCLDSVVTGQEFARPFRRLPAPWFVEKVLLSMARQVSPSMRVGPLSQPHMLMPLIAAAQVVNISTPGAQPHIMQAHEDVRLLCPALAVKAPAAAGGQRPATADARRRHYINPRNRAELRYDPGHVYTFHCYQQWVDLASYKLDFGYTYDLVRHLDGQPLQIMAKDVHSGKYLYNINVWNERLMPQTGAGSAGAGACNSEMAHGAANDAGTAATGAAAAAAAAMQDAEAAGSAASTASRCSDAGSFQDAEEEGEEVERERAARRRQVHGASNAGGEGGPAAWMLNADWGVPRKHTPPL